jgi:hypothetical protein
MMVLPLCEESCHGPTDAVGSLAADVCQKKTVFAYYFLSNDRN